MALKSRRSFLLFAVGDAHFTNDHSRDSAKRSDVPIPIPARRESEVLPASVQSIQQFRQKCVGCMICVKTCPRGLLRVSDGDSHFLRPSLDFRTGWCFPECSLCAKVCPSQALGEPIPASVKDYANLYIMDFICRGLDSPLPGRAFVKWQEEREGSPVVSSKAKNKELGWHKLTNKVIHANGKITYWTRDNSPMTYCYLVTNAFSRPSCYTCPFKGVPRYADISVADCWGAEKLFKGPLAQDIGTSLVMINNSKGRELFEMAKGSMFVQPMEWKVVREGNPMIDRPLPPPKYPRDEVFAVIREKGFQGLMDKFVLPDWEARKKRTLRQKIMARLRRWRSLLRAARIAQCNTLLLLIYWMRDNGLLKILAGAPTFRCLRSNAHVQSDGTIELGGDFEFGGGNMRYPITGSVMQLQKNARLITKGYAGVNYGACIEIFKNCTLTVGRDFGANIGLTIVCGDTITIGDDVMCGRNVTLRNTNGNHPMNIPGAKNSKPLIIGDHVWFCENSTVMAGVKIGSGAVIGAHAVVYNNVPPNTLVMGNPAKVVMENIQWKR